MLQIRNITKKYKKGNEVFTALDDVSFDVDKGDFITVTGHSGSGKSTLLNTIGGLIHPDNGTVLYNDENIYGYPQSKLDEYRKLKVGFIFQQFHLLPYLSVYENIKMACSEDKQVRRIGRYLEECSLSEQRNKFPAQLSVGEKQRTAFIRAIIGGPEFLLADEPTGNLDPGNCSILLDLISEYNKNGGTVILVSHHEPAAIYQTKGLQLQKGKIISQ
ncbi:MAG TPA: ABC transporter ATP-binding protein [Bacteroidales bacterium]|jgi:putative ABC transport system ATP-binding protein|nr:ABC transporter ATP-binding protein [Bacteroidales bacterium]